jgi:energy-converting hydrogenase Eha subunit A
MSITQVTPEHVGKIKTARDRSQLLWPTMYAAYVALWAILFLRHNINYGLDDSFISYRYAQNLADGYGLVFNPGERFFGTTAAGYATALALLHMVTGFAIPKLSIGLTTLAVTAIAACLPTVAREVPGARRWLISAVFATAAFALGPFSQVAGHETVPFIGVAFVGTVCVAYWSRPLLGGLLLAIGTTFRPDVALLAVLTGGLLWLLQGRRMGEFLKSRALRRYAIGYVGALILWLGFLLWQFGTVIPGTLDAKRAQVGLGYWPTYGPAPIWSYLLGFLGVLGLSVTVVGVVAAFIRTTRPALFLTLAWLGFALGAASLYTAIGVTFWFWYAAPIFFGLFAAAFVGWSNLASMRFGWAAVGVAALALLMQLPGIQTWIATPNLKPHIHAYEQAADFIKAESPQGATILMPEPGSFGMRLGPDFTVVDELGLVSPGVAQALLRGETDWAFKSSNPDYLLCSWDGDYTACSQGLQKQGYEFVGEFDKWFWDGYVGRGNRLFRRIGLESSGAGVLPPGSMFSATVLTGPQETASLPRAGAIESVTREGGRLTVAGWADVPDSMGGAELVVVTSAPGEVLKVQRLSRSDLPADRTRAGFSITTRTTDEMVCILAGQSVVNGSDRELCP